ncbi:DUF4192 domain-containing protein [Demequina rhizosphaerae]|uniref:DUF4192 domain-containing protein n=1 Tax=Demequina rhizosphaerae TaxID=1638985 RepID=UPI000782D2A8|nr:DUF4192 domain-containing protein [Demequina rhizosphaerae]
MTTITGPGELVSLLPSLLGFEPRESVVAVLLRERGALGAILRLDVWDLVNDAASEAARDLARIAMQEGARRAVVVGYADDEDDGCLAVATAAVALEETVAAVETWMVAGSRYYCPSCEDPRCCPPGGRTVPAARPGGTSAWSVAADPGASRAPARERRLASRAAGRWEDRAAKDLEAWREASARCWRVALEEGADGPAPLGRLAAALGDVRVRDALLLMLVPGASRAVRDALAGRDSAAISKALGVGMRPTRPPDAGRVALVTDLLVAVLEHAPQRLCAPAAATLGVIAWWEDDPDVARAWCAIALDHDPGYRLALLTLALIDAVGSPP